MRHTAASRARHRRTLETQRPHGACRVQVEHVEYVTEVERRRLHFELNMTVGKHGQTLEALRRYNEITHGARA